MCRQPRRTVRWGWWRRLMPASYIRREIGRGANWHRRRLSSSWCRLRPRIWIQRSQTGRTSRRAGQRRMEWPLQWWKLYMISINVISCGLQDCCSFERGQKIYRKFCRWPARDCTSRHVHQDSPSRPSHQQLYHTLDTFRSLASLSLARGPTLPSTFSPTHRRSTEHVIYKN